MKTRILFVTLFAMIFTTISTQAQTLAKGKKILIAYYSLRNGNTRIMAEHIQRNIGGDIFRIETVDAYPEVYKEVTTLAKKELEAEYRPPLKTKVENIDTYDIIFVGSPNWWNTIATPVMTFLESYNLKGKTIIPFITHEGSRMGASEADIKKLCPQATVLKGLPIRGGDVENAKPNVAKWLREINMIN